MLPILKNKSKLNKRGKALVNKTPTTGCKYVLLCTLSFSLNKELHVPKNVQNHLPTKHYPTRVILLHGYPSDNSRIQNEPKNAGVYKKQNQWILEITQTRDIKTDGPLHILLTSTGYRDSAVLAIACETVRLGTLQHQLKRAI